MNSSLISYLNWHHSNLSNISSPDTHQIVELSMFDLFTHNHESLLFTLLHLRLNQHNYSSDLTLYQDLLDIIIDNDLNISFMLYISGAHELIGDLTQTPEENKARHDRTKYILLLAYDEKFKSLGNTSQVAIPLTIKMLILNNFNCGDFRSEDFARLETWLSTPIIAENIVLAYKNKLSAYLDYGMHPGEDCYCFYLCAIFYVISVLHDSPNIEPRHCEDDALNMLILGKNILGQIPGLAGWQAWLADFSHRHSRQKFKNEIQKIQPNAAITLNELDLVFKRYNEEITFDEPIGPVSTKQLSLQRRLGKGTYATTILVDLSGHHYALKVFSNSAGNSQASLFAHYEASMLSGLDHPNIISSHGQMHYAGLYSGILLSYAPNNNLYKFVRSNNFQFPKEKILNLCKGVISGLRYLHTNNIYHLDLSITNILLDAHEQPIISDFGMAIKPDDTNQTHCNMGAIYAMPAEAVRRFLLDEHTALTAEWCAGIDVASIGILTFLLITNSYNKFFEIFHTEENLYSQAQHRDVFMVKTADLYDVGDCATVLDVALNCNVLFNQPNQPSLGDIEHAMKPLAYGS